LSLFFKEWSWYFLSSNHVGLPASPPPAPGSLNNGLSNVNDPRLRPFAVDVGNHRETRSRGIIVIIVLSSVFAFILCAGAALVIYFKLRNRNLLTGASLTPTKPAGSNTFFLWIVPFFIIQWGTIEESREN
jgi:hypothetical protein